MVFILLAPYNDSMELGQGFNSFLQLPRMNGAVEIPPSSLRTEAARSGGATNVSQVVSYSSRFVEKISDVVRSMNISAASSIKSGTIEVSGNSLSVDESKFASSDLNAVISVKVINQTTTSAKNPRFVPLSDDVHMDSEKFFQTYGDCYISGFMEGGDLHGIVSMKVLDATKASRVESALKGAMNGAAGEFTLSEGSGSSALEAAARETETTITVNWSGGGQIKSDEEEWTLDSLIRAASSFPGRVAGCPQRTWAILTPYDRNRSFINWADQRGIKVPSFDKVQQYTHDCLDNFMEYKNCLARIQQAIVNPPAFKVSPYRNAINLGVVALVAERKKIKAEMAKIIGIIDQLNLDPTSVVTEEVQAPEIWATRLPVPVNARSSTGELLSSAHRNKVIAGFAFTGDPIADVIHAQPAEDVQAKLSEAMQEVKQDVAEEKAAPEVTVVPSLAELCTTDIVNDLNEKEREFVQLEENRRVYAPFRFDRHTGHDGGGPFNDAEELQQALVPVTWPKRVEFYMLNWGGDARLRQVRILYDQIQLTHGSEGTVIDSMIIDLAPDEKINRIRTAKGVERWGVEGVAFIEVHTTAGNVRRLGDESGKEIIDSRPYDGAVGLKGFWGGAGDVLDKMGPIWGLPRDI